MAYMNDLFDPVDYRAMIDGGYIKERVHPDHPTLRIVNYTEKCMWESVWNEVTLQCRGIIYSSPSGTVIARPFAKFFNHGQKEAPLIELGESVVVTDKLDGSLGILYHATGVHEPSIATRGSFESDQAIWATQFFRENYPISKWIPQYGWTYLFEIIYPSNRIVVDYGAREDLVLLGAIDRESGRSVQLKHAAVGWPGSVAETFPVHTFGEALALEPRPNVEGIVVHTVRSDVRVKIKQEDYLLLHRFMTRTTPKHVWEVLSAGQDPFEVFKEAPDEFQVWLRDTIRDFLERFNIVKSASELLYSLILKELLGGRDPQVDEDIPRKEFAEKAVKLPNSAILFKMLDDRPVDDVIWKLLKPSGKYIHAIREVNPDAD